MNKICTICKQNLSLNLYYKRSRGKHGRMAECKSCSNNRSKKYHQDNKEERHFYFSEYRKSNLEECRSKERDRYHTNKEEIVERKRKYRQENRDQTRQTVRRYYQNNKAYLLARSAKQRAHLLKANPSWANEDKIKEVYTKAQELTTNTGIKHEVDHIIPLRSDKVCGLHVEYNLQILTAEENNLKSNKF